MSHDRTVAPTTSTTSPAPSTARQEMALTTEGRRLLEERIAAMAIVLADLADGLQDPERRDGVVEPYQRTARELEQLRALLDGAATLDDLPDDPRRVDLGEHVSIRLEDGAEETYVVVHRVEAVVDDARISMESPLGRALLGREVGDSVEVSGPAGPYRCTILSASRCAPGARG